MCIRDSSLPIAVIVGQMPFIQPDEAGVQVIADGFSVLDPPAVGLIETRVGFEFSIKPVEFARVRRQDRANSKDREPAENGPSSSVVYSKNATTPRLTQMRMMTNLGPDVRQEV